MGATKKGDKLIDKTPAVSPEQALANYVTELNKEYGGYARVLGDVRSIIDGAMGSESLTGLLYKSRNEGGPDLR